MGDRSASSRSCVVRQHHQTRPQAPIITTSYTAHNDMKRRQGYDQRCSSPLSVTARLLLSFLAISSPVQCATPAPLDFPNPPLPLVPDVPTQDGHHNFFLRHIFHHGTYDNPNLHKRHDISPESSLWSAADEESAPYSGLQPVSARSHSSQIHRLTDRRPSSVEAYLSRARDSGRPVVLGVDDWRMDDVDSPNITDKETVVNLAIMAANAYVPVIGEGEWENGTGGYNESQPFGWESDGLRGYIFADDGNKTIIVSLKGTSPAVFDGEETTTKDKTNDNLFASCCCGQGGNYLWRQVCDCYSTTYTCNQTCLVKAVKNKNRYYQAGLELYSNVTELYPDSNVWLTGHSLGGVVASLLGLTYGVPTTTFEAYGDALAAGRLSLPSPPGTDPSRPQERKYTGAYHFGNTADPVFMGSCNGATALCTLGGYALESQCHTGQQCVYDTVGDFGWRVGVGNHKIHAVIETVLKQYDQPAKCEPDTECVDCYNWKYFESNGSDPKTSTSSSTTHSRTRTTTCETPGWWGCLDKTSTSETSTTTSTSTSTTTCKTPGWFGCKDPTTTTTTSATATPSARLTSPSATKTESSTTSCAHPGFFGGCNDPTTTASSSKTHSPSSKPHHSSCKTPGFFWGCKDKPRPTAASVAMTTGSRTEESDWKTEI